MNSEQIKCINLKKLIEMGEFVCDCGKKHSVGTKHVVIEKDAIKKLPELLRLRSVSKPFILSGEKTFASAGEKVCTTLENAGFSYGKYVFPHSPVQPTEETVGSAIMHFDYSCDCIVAVGSGVINDTGKILAHATGRPYTIVATAPSMDGFASATSSMDMDGLKVSLDSTFAWAVIGDLDILAQAPMHMLQAGVGDMLAKYISLCEWRIAHLLIGEYYCPVVDALVENALDRVVKAGPALVRREPEAVKAVMEGMVIAGMAMKYAGLSRPASGMEHYFSHLWDMRSLAFSTQSDLHGIQCGVGTLLSLKVYDYIRELKPNREKALAYAADFDVEAWNGKLLAFVGPGAEAMIKGEKKEGKYDKAKHARRLELIIDKWDEIMSIVNTMPSYDTVLAIMEGIGAPTSAASFGVSDAVVKTAFTMTKDIRDKYIASRLLWDLGELDEAADKLF